MALDFLEVFFDAIELLLPPLVLTLCVLLDLILLSVDPTAQLLLLLNLPVNILDGCIHRFFQLLLNPSPDVIFDRLLNIHILRICF